MPTRLLLIHILFLLMVMAIPGIVLADAGKGMFMGYELGNRYERSENTRLHNATNGNLIITAEKPVKPDDIEEVFLVTTPESLTIGHINAASWFENEVAAREFGRRYINLLRARYPDWAFGREGMDNDLRIVEANFDRTPYNLRVRLSEDDRNGTMMWRLSMTLSWMLDSEQELAWRNTSRSEHVTAKQEGRRELLENADLRGL